MNFSPYQWRANSGCLPNPNQPAPLCTSYPHFTSPQLQPGFAHHLYYPSTGQIAAIPPPPPAQPKKTNKGILPPPKPPSTVAASTTTSTKTLVTPITPCSPNATCTCTTTFNPQTNTYTTICTCSQEDPPAPEVKKAPSMAHSTSANPPPTLRPGENYMFPPEHTLLHVFNKAAPIWNSKYHGQGLAFKMFKVATSFTVANVIERVLKKKGDECAGWCATEVVEQGEGCWAKGTSIPWGSDKAKGTLGSMGWGVKRGGEGPPVWLVVCKEE
ncbi:uncharacterized protein RCC_00299 [Ramularia collo-cygni]|uniref:Uncharacterized protein n=1 Tax=Ramularia collo-cygni TaxID=112498 RepID=A0A2D3ULA9_9PEZI|nr:uncharacterized protein RCC_00299 [Ramularia collo-cygni]CZT14322.1 uncharacterized protein RCC_00299 [Ramularia collo-cygni]